MEKIDDLISVLKNQEKELQFYEFTSETALKIGLSIIERAKRENKIISVDITRNGHQLFHYSFEGTSPDHDQWIIRKNRVVNRFNKSSLRVGMELSKCGKSLEEESYISSFEFTANGGSFPIIVKNVGVIGTITVSGLAEKDDHEIVVAAISEYLGNKK